MSDKQDNKDIRQESLFTILAETEKMANVGGWIWDLRKDHWTFTENWLHLHGCSKRNISKEDFLGIVHPEDREGIRNAIKAAVEKGVNYEIEHRIIRQDSGEERCVRAFGEIRRDADGNFEKLLGATQDITKRKEAQQITKQGETKFRALFEESANPIVIFGETGITECNNAAVKMLGCKDKADLLSRHPAEFSPERQPDGRLTSEKSKEMDAIAMKNGFHRFDWQHKRIDTGNEFPVEVILKKIVLNGEDFILTIWNDLTERKKAEEEIERNKTQLRTLIDSIDAVVYMKDVEGRHIIVNEYYTQAVGVEAEDVIGKLDSDIMPIEDAERIMQVDRRILDSAKSESFEEDVPHPDGTYHTYLTTKVPLLDENQKVYGLCGLAKDITDLKQVERQLKENQEEFRFSLESMGAYYWTVDFEAGSAHYDSDTFYTQYGYSENEIPDKLDDFINLIHPEDLPKTMEVLQQHMDGVVPVYSAEYRLKKKSGDWVWTWHMGRLVEYDASGKGIRMAGLTHDITNQKNVEAKIKANERQLQTLIETIPGTVYRCLLDKDWTMVFINDEAEKLTGYPADDFLSNDRTFESVIHPDDSELVSQTIHDAVKKGKSYTIEYRIIRKDGKIRHAYEKGQAEIDETGKAAFLDGTILDITDRKNTEDELKDAQSRLNFALRSAQMGAWSYDIPKNIFSVDETIRSILDFEPDKTVTLETVFSIVHPEDIGIVTARYNNLITEQESLSLHYRIIRKDGEVRWIDSRGRAFKNEKGEVGYATGILTDVSEQKRASDQIKKLSVSVEQNPTTIIITDLDGNIEYANPRFYELTGYSIEDVIGKNPRFLNSGVHSKQYFKKMWETITSGDRWKGEFCNRKKNGELYWEMASISPLKNEAGTVTHFVAVKEDITERRTMEERLETERRFLQELLDTSPISVVIVALDTTVKYANKAVTNLYGLKEGDLAFERYVNRNDVDYIVNEIAGKRSVFDYATKIYGLKDEIIEMLANYIPIEYKGEPSILSWHVDISPLKEIERQLQTAKEAAEAATRAKSDFLASMSHEIRTPMNAVLGYAELLEKLVEGDLQKSYLNSIRTGGKSLLTLINDILDLSKIEAGKLSIEYSHFNIKALINEIETIFTLKVKEKGLSLVTNINEDVPDYIYLDEIRLRQILINLVSNAVKFTDKGSIELSLYAKESKASKKQSSQVDLFIEVKDTGIGISEEWKSKIFESFTQKEGQNIKRYGGTGLGLTISQNLSKLMNGSISVLSEEGQGSTFTLQLNGVQVSSEKLETGKEEDVVIEKIRFYEAIILIVDDNEDNRNYLKGILVDYGFTLIEAENGLDALQKLDEFSIDLVITDLRMPKMDGFEMMKQITANDSLQNIPIIATSASVMLFSDENVKSYGFRHYLPKPFSIKDLITCLSKILPCNVGDLDKEPGSDDLSESIQLEVADSENFSKELTMLENLQAVLKEHQSREDVEAFANKLEEVGRLFSVKPLEEYGASLRKSKESFDIETMLSLINGFPELIQTIRKAMRKN